MCWKNFIIWKKKLKFLVINNLFYRLKCRKNTESKIPKVFKTKNGRIMFLSKCEVGNVIK